jgi:hypothetical protein
VLAGGRAIGRIPVVVARAVPAVSSLELAARFLTRPTTLVVLVVLLGLAAAVSARRREHARGRASA